MKKISKLIISILLALSFVLTAVGCDARPIEKPMNTAMAEAASAVLDSEYVSASFSAKISYNGISMTIGGKLYTQKTDDGYDLIITNDALPLFEIPAKTTYYIDGKVGEAYKVGTQWVLVDEPETVGTLKEIMGEEEFASFKQDYTSYISSVFEPLTSQIANRTEEGYEFSAQKDFSQDVNKFLDWVAGTKNKSLGKVIFSFIDEFCTIKEGMSEQDFQAEIENIFVDGLSVSDLLDKIVGLINSTLPEGETPLNLKTVFDEIQEEQGFTTQEIIDSIKGENEILLPDATEGQTLYDYLYAYGEEISLDALMGADPFDIGGVIIDSLGDLQPFVATMLFNDELSIGYMLEMLFGPVDGIFTLIDSLEFTELGFDTSLVFDAQNRFSSFDFTFGVGVKGATQAELLELVQAGEISESNLELFMLFATQQSVSMEINYAFDYSKPDIEFQMPTMG